MINRGLNKFIDPYRLRTNEYGQVMVHTDNGYINILFYKAWHKSAVKWMNAKLESNGLLSEPTTPKSTTL